MVNRLLVGMNEVSNVQLVGSVNDFNPESTSSTLRRTMTELFFARFIPRFGFTMFPGRRLVPFF